MFRFTIGMLGIAALMLGGCASYVTPGRGADMSSVGVPKVDSVGPGTDHSIRQSFDKVPMAHFPAAIAMARIQDGGYQSRTAHGWGEGSYCLLTTRDIEKPEQIERLTKLPQVHGIAPLNRMLVTGKLDSDFPLRQAAAKLQADMLLIYTLDTVFDDADKAIPLSVITLGLSPSRQIRMTTTASAVLMDTRNGFIYGLAEATAQQSRMASSWQSANAIDESRRKTEADAFDKLVGEFETTWAGVVSTYAKQTPMTKLQ